MAFPAGCNTIFYQATAPTGWTTSTTYPDSMLRIVSGNGGVYNSGGTAFSTFFTPTRALNPVTGYNAVDVGGAGTADIPAHTHAAPTLRNATGSTGQRRGPASGGPGAMGIPGPRSSPAASPTSPGSHTHPFQSGVTFTVPAANLNFGINYLDFIVATKN